MRAVKMSLTVQLVIISLTLFVHSINFSDAVFRFRFGKYRCNKPMPMTSQQIKTIVDHHNELRAGEGADNMELITYNESLAKRAEDWAAQCVFRHPGEELHPLKLGQNIIRRNAPQQTPRSAMGD